MNPEKRQMKRPKIFFPRQMHFPACLARFSLLEMCVETVIFPFPGALIFKELAHRCKDLLQDTRFAGEVFLDTLAGPVRPVFSGAVVANHKMQNKLFKNSGFAPGFFEGKPRGKQINKNTSE